MRIGRVTLAIVSLVIVQVALFPHLRLFGVVPDVGLVLAMAVSYRHGAEAGALVGFAFGFTYDLFLETPLGMSALSYAITAYVFGVLLTGVLRAPRWMPLVLGGVAGLVGGLTFIGIGGLVGVEGMWTARALGVVALAACYDVLIAPVVFFLVNRLSPPERDAAVFRTAR
jgi:rod shape-determining protein MreD